MSYFTNQLDDQIVKLLQNGAVGLLPSDTIYGLSARALDEHAVERIYKVKGRDAGKPPIVLIADIAQLAELGVNPKQAELVKKYWPAPLSVIFESSQIPRWLERGTNSLAVRFPNYPRLCDLVAKTGPIISSSANLQGQEPVKSATEAKKIFGDKLDFYVDTGNLSGQPSTLVKIVDSNLQVLRQGAAII